MKKLLLFFALSFTLNQSAEAVTNLDRVYTADEISNTVSVIDPSRDTLIGQIPLGKIRALSFSSRVRNDSQVNVHGLDISPDHRTLAVTATITNSVSFVDTETNKVKGTVYVGRSPHIATYRPDGKEVWAAVRGESYISVINPITMRKTVRIPTAPGPSLVLFHPTKPHAYVLSGFTPVLEVFHTSSHRLIKSIPVAGSFSATGAMSPDGKEAWVVLRDVNKLLRFNTESNTIIENIDSGLLTNHVGFAQWQNKTYALATIGGESLVKIYELSHEKAKLVASTPVLGVPHGIWASPNGQKIYVGLEYEDEVVVLDSDKNWAVHKRINIGQSPQTLIYVKNAVRSQDGNKNISIKSAEEKTYSIPLNHLNPKLKEVCLKCWGAVSLRNYYSIDFIKNVLWGFPPSFKDKLLRVYAVKEKTAFGVKYGSPKLVLLAWSHLPKEGTLRIESVFPAPAEELRELLLKQNARVVVLEGDEKNIDNYILRSW